MRHRRERMSGADKFAWFVIVGTIAYLSGHIVVALSRGGF